MSSRSAQLSPHASTREARLSIVAGGPASTRPRIFPDGFVLRYWPGDLVDLDDFVDSDLEALEDASEAHSIWIMLPGLPS